jgi:hypothetical protein
LAGKAQIDTLSLNVKIFKKKASGKGERDRDD